MDILIKERLLQLISDAETMYGHEFEDKYGDANIVKLVESLIDEDTAIQNQSVPLPVNSEQATAMIMVGMRWLNQRSHPHAEQPVIIDPTTSTMVNVLRSMAGQPPKE